MSETKPDAPALATVLRNCEQAFRYAFSAQQEALWERIRPFTQITSDPEDVEMREYGMRIDVHEGLDFEGYPVLSERVHQAAQELAVLPANFALSALLGVPVAGAGLHNEIRLTDDEFRPLVRDGEFDDPRQIVTIPSDRHLCEESVFNESVFRAVMRAFSAARDLDVPLDGWVLIGHPSLEQRGRIALPPAFGGARLGTGDGLRMWFTPAIPHPDVAILVGVNRREDQKPCEFVLDRFSVTSETNAGERRGYGWLYVRARMGFRVHRSPWVVRIEPEDYCWGGVPA